MPTINNGGQYMQAITYTGTGSTQTIAVGFQPDFVWIKSRSAATDHKLTDSVRGVTKALISDTTGAETTDANGVTAFTSNGFTIGSDSVYNTNAATYVAWQWKAGGTSASNTNGSITSTVSVGATQGFSVVTYTLNNSTFTVGHGLGVAPNMIIVKDRDTTNNWDIYHSSIGAGSRLTFTTSTPDVSSQVWNNTAPTSTVFSGNSAWWTNPSTSKMVAYCFAAVAGYSAFGSYTGNGSTDGPFVFTNFSPRWVMVKRTDTADDWFIIDTSRNTYNVATSALYPNSSSSETSNGFYNLDILSNGFKVRATNAVVNASGGTYIYACFASNPMKFSNAK